MKILSKFVAVLAILPVLAFASPVFAGSPGQLAGGDDLEAKNVTQNGTYADTTSATCNDEVQYSMMLSNTQFGALNNVTLKVNLPSAGGVATATATTDLGGTSGTSDTTTVNLGSGQTIAYENGSTVLYDDHAHIIKSLPDGVTTTSGVNMGTLNGSTTVFLDFKAKVSCAPVVTTFTSTATATATAAATATCTDGAQGSATATASASATATATSTVSQADADSKAQAAAQDKADADAQAKADAEALAEVTCSAPKVKTTAAHKAKATVLPNTGAGDVAEVFAGSSVLGTVGHYFVSRRRK